MAHAHSVYYIKKTLSENPAERQCFVFPRLSSDSFSLRVGCWAPERDIIVFIVLHLRTETTGFHLRRDLLDSRHTTGARVLPCGQDAHSEAYGFVLPFFLIKSELNQRVF